MQCKRCFCGIFENAGRHNHSQVCLGVTRRHARLLLLQKQFNKQEVNVQWLTFLLLWQKQFHKPGQNRQQTAVILFLMIQCFEQMILSEWFHDSFIKSVWLVPQLISYLNKSVEWMIYISLFLARMNQRFRTNGLNELLRLIHKHSHLPPPTGVTM